MGPLVHHKPHVVCPAMHTEQTPVAIISYFAPLYMLLEIIHIPTIANYRVELLVQLRNTTSQIIKKQGDFGGNFWQKKMQLMTREKLFVTICRIKLITIIDYSPTNKSDFCLMKQLTQT
jgi:hypothetical protein